MRNIWWSLVCLALACGDDDGGPMDASMDGMDAMPTLEPEICDNGIDDNGDGAIDCADIQCLAPPDDDPSTASRRFLDQVRFLYEGSTSGACAGMPIQRDVSIAFEEGLASVIRGRVMDATGANLPGVRVEVIGHPEYGYTESRADGMFDLVVHAGDLAVRLTHAERITVQRNADVGWNEFVWVEDSAPALRDTAVSTIEAASSRVEVARASAVSDSDGNRQATLMFAPGTMAMAQMPGGGEVPLTSYSVRITEVTVGPNGAAAMPGELPPSSAYTYAVEAEVDEAVAMGAQGVRFSEPVAFYVESFLDFSVGSAVPVGYFDRQAGGWTPMRDGTVVEVASKSGGRAHLDLDGDGAADDDAAHSAAGITDDERTRIADLYDAGARLWRVEVEHFSPLDFNWPFSLPGGARNPDNECRCTPLSDQSCVASGSIIECENQTLGESMPVAGSGHRLEYRSDRTPGREDLYTLEIVMIDGAVPPDLKRVELEVRIAGQSIVRSFEPEADLSTLIRWNGVNAYGRRVPIAQPYVARVGYVYDAVYLEPDELAESFGRFGSTASADRTRNEITVWADRGGTLGTWDARTVGLGGLTLSPHHTYDPVARVLYEGNGGRRSVEPLARSLTHFAGRRVGGPIAGDEGPAREAPLWYPEDVAVAPDGTVYIADSRNHAVRYVTPDGIIHRLAGTGSQGSGGDGGPALSAELSFPGGVEVGSDGSVYVIDSGNDRIRRIDPSGTIHAFAGNGSEGDGGDGGLAVDAELEDPTDLIFAADGVTAYIADSGNARIRRVDPDGRIWTHAGRQVGGVHDEGARAADTHFRLPSSLAIAPDGGLYVAESAGSTVRHVRADGRVYTFAGFTAATEDGDGGPALDAAVPDPRSLAIADDGAVLIAEERGRIRRVSPEGIITTIVGATNAGDIGGPARAVELVAPRGIAIGPDGSLYIAEYLRDWVMRVAPALPRTRVGDIAIAGTDGMSIYIFDSVGTHLRTLDSTLGNTLFEFDYDERVRLAAITDQAGDTIVVERDADDMPTLIGPFGHRTRVETSLLDVGWASAVTFANGDTWQLEYHDRGGLLRTFTDPESHQSTFAYDEGRLVLDEGPDGSSAALTRMQTPTGYRVVHTTALDHQHVHEVMVDATGDVLRTFTGADGSLTESVLRADGTRTTTRSDGTEMSFTLAPDPRFGMQRPYVNELRIELPSGALQTMTFDQSVTLDVDDDPFSMSSATSTAEIDGRAWTTSYNRGAGEHTLRVRTPMGRERTLVIDDDTRLRAVRGPEIHDIALDYDSHGRLTRAQQVEPGGRMRSIELDYTLGGTDAGPSRRMVNGAGQELIVSLDPIARVSEATLPGGEALALGWDGNSLVTSFSRGGLDVHGLAYDSRGRPARYDPPPTGGDVDTWEYDLEGKLALYTLADGRMVRPAYDAFGRLASVTSSRGTAEIRWQSTGAIGGATSPEGAAVDLTFDGSLLDTVTWSGAVRGSLDFDYDTQLRNDSIVVAGATGAPQTITYGFDDDDLLTSAGGMTVTRRATDGAVERATIGGVATDFDFDGFGDHTLLAHTWGGDGLSFAMQHDDLGRIREVTETRGASTTTRTYEYDSGGRLRFVRRGAIVDEQYDYDSAGRRIAVINSAGSSAASYDSRDRLLSAGGRTYTYGASGQLETIRAGASTTRLDYDELGNLLEATLPDGRRVTYLVDAFGRRIQRSVDGVVTSRWIYQNAYRPIAELDASGAIVAVFVAGLVPHAPDVMIRGGRTYRMLKDPRGSVRVVVDATSGAVVQEIDYDAFGRVLRDTNPGYQPFGFAGGMYDPDTGLVRFGARDYEADTGQFTTRDPWLIAGGVELYGYARNDPINRIDPTGRHPILVFALVGGGLNMAAQLLMDAGSCMSTRQRIGRAASAFLWGALAGAFSGGIGGVGAGIGGVLFRAGANGLVGGLTNAAHQATTNAIGGGGAGSVADAFGYGAVGGAMGSAVGDGIGAAARSWGRGAQASNIAARDAAIESGQLGRATEITSGYDNISRTVGRWNAAGSTIGTAGGTAVTATTPGAPTYP